MKKMPTLTDRIMCMLAKMHAQRVYRSFCVAAQQAVKTQERVLLAMIRRTADSDFGRHHGFAGLRSVADFRKRMPIATYEDHRPYIDRVKAGDTRAMFGRGQRVHMFALTSGTSDQPKHIPVTDEYLKEYRAGWNGWGIKALLDHEEAILREIAQVSSRMDESRTTSGIPCGAITGLIAATQKRLVRKYYVTPGCLARIDDASAKYYTIMRLAMARDVAWIITASPATQLKLARTGVEHAEAIIRDIHDGTLRAEVPVPGEVRQALQPRLKPDAVRAAELERLLHEHGRLLPRHYWNLSFLANWTGGTMGLYLRDFPEYFGDLPVRDVGLIASEGRVSTPIEDGTAAGMLNVDGHFFEFMPVEERESASPQTCLCHEVEVGREYYVLLTTSSGLYRYDLGDVVRVTGFVGQAPLVEFLNKGNHISSLAGEKLTEHQVIMAMQRASNATRLPVATFVLAPKWGQPPCYVLHVEPIGTTGPAPLHDLAAALERELCGINIEYASKRDTQRLGPIQLHLLAPGVLTEMDNREASRYRKSNEQYKHRYLYCRPGEDEHLGNPS
jgi:hypothetical protein